MGKPRRRPPSFPEPILSPSPSRMTTGSHRTLDETVTSYPGGSLVGTAGSPENNYIGRLQNSIKNDYKGRQSLNLMNFAV